MAQLSRRISQLLVVALRSRNLRLLFSPSEGSTEVTRPPRPHSRLHERAPCSGANQHPKTGRCYWMALLNTELHATGLVGCPGKPNPRHGRDAISRRPQE